jgi:hypothetical protein
MIDVANQKELTAALEKNEDIRILGEWSGDIEIPTGAKIKSLKNEGRIKGWISNSGTVTGGISNSGTGTVGWIFNSGTGTVGGISNSGTVTGGISNSGTVTGGISNYGTVTGWISNSGTVTGWIFNSGQGTVGWISNSGTGTVGRISNSGTVTGGRIFNSGTVTGWYLCGVKITESQFVAAISSKNEKEPEPTMPIVSDLDEFKRLSELGYRRVEKVAIEYIKI